jgi:hypothetical protein
VQDRCDDAEEIELFCAGEADGIQRSLTASNGMLDGDSNDQKRINYLEVAPFLSIVDTVDFSPALVEVFILLQGSIE